ncbi:MAG: RnfABCDGE type electron transport complex subunit D [Pseudomonadales bacterium]|nr:RnfABCDGE type electron transport complex subunit D [Pseudomonadales bacterium]
MITTPRLMQQFLLALIPGSLAMLYVFGPGVAVNIFVAVVAAVGLEFFALKVRGLPPANLLDGSAVVTGLLLALALPPLLPIWMIVVGVAFAILLAKHVYGGLGHNLFNPAMIGFAVLIVSFPLAMSRWAPPLTDVNFLQLMSIKLGAPIFDAVTMATPLDDYKFRSAVTNDEYWTLAKNGKWQAWMIVNVAFLISGLYLLYKRICRWHAPVAMLATLAILSALSFDSGSSNSLGSPLFHLLSGATMLGAFFIVTDPVTSPDSTRGQLIFGIGVGVLTFIIRSFGAYPEGLAFAILLMNGVTPLINYVEFRL